MKRKKTITALLLAVFYCLSLVHAGAEGANLAPIPQSAEYETYKGIAIYGNATAVDPEGDSVFFSVTRDPKKGNVTLEQNGSFVYTPHDGKKGRDSFGFIAVDSLGNVSVEATVTVTIKKQKTRVFYEDNCDTDYQYASLYLAENGIYTGRMVGDCYFFDGDKTVSRVDFLVMCMKICKIDSLNGITETGFFDDDTISQGLKPYVASALLNGIVSGRLENGNVVFSAEAPISVAEASVTLNNAMELNDVYVGSVNDTCPVWAQQASANLSSVNISLGEEYEVDLTMSQAAKILLNAAKIIANR